jgi:hypothetical protein
MAGVTNGNILALTFKGATTREGAVLANKMEIQAGGMSLC